MQLIQQLEVYFYQEISGNEPVRDWLHTLSVADRKIIGRDIRIIQVLWPVDNLLVKPLEHKLWEIRSRLDNRIARVIFVFHNGSIVLVHGFIKKTEKTPPAEIELARKRAKLL